MPTAIIESLSLRVKMQALDVARDDLNAPAIICAENIAALHLLHPIPALPSRNSVANSHDRSKGYTLPLETERRLCGTLAFLARPNHNANHITAVCIEEDGNAGSLNVLIAINKAKPDDGKHVLGQLKRSFEDIFSLLGKIDSAKDSASDTTDGVLGVIVSMCSKRILERLEMVRVSIGLALGYLGNIRHDHIQEPEISNTLRPFIERATELSTLMGSWEKDQTQQRLQEVVKGVYRLKQAGRIHALIEIIPNKVMNPSLRSSFEDKINKVARYREAARYLCRKAKKIPQVRNMRVVLAEPPREAFERVPVDKYAPALQAAILRIDGLKEGETNLGTMCRLLSSTVEKASSGFVEQARKTLEESKIHAEIQLLYWCSLKASGARSYPHPRVVCSCKDACWLCNEFVLTYAGVHTPGTHGKLYPGWRLPALGGPEFDGLAESFNQRLEKRVRESVRDLIHGKGLPKYTGPNESTLLTLSASTLLSAPPSLSAMETVTPEPEPIANDIYDGEYTEGDIAASGGEPAPGSAVSDIPGGAEEAPPEVEPAISLATSPPPPAEREDDSRVGHPSPQVYLPPPLPSSPSPTSSFENSPIVSPTTAVEPEADGSPALPDPQVSSSPPLASSPPPASPSASGGGPTAPAGGAMTTKPLRRGGTRSAAVAAGGTSPLFAAGRALEIQIEHVGSPGADPTAGAEEKALVCDIEWLAPGDAEGRAARVVDAAALGEGEEVSLTAGAAGADGCVYIRAGDAVLRVVLEAGGGGGGYMELVCAVDEERERRIVSSMMMTLHHLHSDCMSLIPP
ncbi:hypothetical protein GGS23DRAFT_613281 [Durotheca rogersii]|uniref:uncharacterized protein n=1 Tax=Durotheca rogersii TaxID=419775 RepID=UPI00221E936A|nr:uncharacterized protein GGS23DRAFT_613281 [Durotheca rogersii]KAI5861100.1 hypothetical protein GGS23DRAFT_613281 [Durotheca rogersii]